MKRIHWFPWTAAMISALTMFSSGPVIAAQSHSQVASTTAPMVSDVRLTAGGIVKGSVVNPQGSPIPSGSVTVYFDDNEVARTKTDDSGHFQIAGLRGGVHQVVTSGGRTTLRFWENDTAPPVAVSSVLIVSGHHCIRGQNCRPGCAPACAPCGTSCGPACGPGYGCYLHAKTLVVGGFIAAAIAVPIALSNDDDDSGS